MSEHGTIIAPDTIVFRRTLPGPVERVWAYLTDSDRRAEWLAAGPMELSVGGQVALEFRHQDLSPSVDPAPERYRDLEQGGAFSGRITRCEPPRVLAYTWAESWGDHSEVTFELEPDGQHVMLTLTHRRLVPDAFISVAAGWHTHLGILADRLAGRVPESFWRAHDILEREYARRLAILPTSE